MYTRSKNGLTYYFKPFIFSMILVAPLQAQANPESIIQIFQRLETVEQKARELTPHRKEKPERQALMKSKLIKLLLIK